MNTEPEVDLHAALQTWQHAVPTEILHHGEACCADAKAWFLAMDASETGSESLLQPPVWLAERYSWGPAKWPMRWCEVIRDKILECGPLAALARASYIRRGIRAFPVQIVKLESASTVTHWKKRWEEAGYSADWMKGRYAFHETVGIVVDSCELRIWDPTEYHWIDKDAQGITRGMVALRVCAEVTDWPGNLSWGEKSIDVNRWNVFAREGT